MMDWSDRSTPAGWRLIFAADLPHRRMLERASLCLLALPILMRVKITDQHGCEYWHQGLVHPLISRVVHVRD